MSKKLLLLLEQNSFWTALLRIKNIL